MHTVLPSNQVLLFGYPAASRIGIAACAITTSSGITHAAHNGYDVLTYKTIRSSYHPISSSRIYAVDCNDQLTLQDIGKQYSVCDCKPSSYNSLAITNSFGVNSQDREMTIHDIAQARASLIEGQILIVSIYGSGKNHTEQIQDFVDTARIAYEGGAQVIEANLSCPNLSTQTMIYQQPDLVYTLCHALHTALPMLPLSIKVGVFEHREQMRAVLLAAYAGGARGVCGINTIPIRVVDEAGNPIFGPDHVQSGLSGSPIQELALCFVRDARAIIDEERLDCILLATGGVTQPEHFDLFFQAGADCVLSATGAMFNKNLAIDYHKLYGRYSRS